MKKKPTNSPASSRSTLGELARAYVRTIEAIEQTSDCKQLQELEEERVIRHNRFADALRHAGIPFENREDVTRIAFEIAKKKHDSS